MTISTITADDNKKELDDKTGFSKGPAEDPTFVPTKQELDQYIKIYSNIRKKWSELVLKITDIPKEVYQNPGTAKELQDTLRDFAQLMGKINSELEGLGKSSDVRASIDSLVFASAEDYQHMLQVFEDMVVLFDQNKQKFERLAKNAELDQQPVLTMKDIKELDKTLDRLDHLLEKHKEDLSKDAPDPKQVEQQKTVLMSYNPDDALVVACLLIEAANRLDLRPPSQTSKELLRELLSFLKALRECYQAMHWVSRGEAYGSDHQLFSDLWAGVGNEVDALAEKAVGYTDDAFVVEVQYGTTRMAAHVTEIMSFLPDMTNIQCMLNAEKKLSKEIIPQMLNSMEQAGELSDGMENFLQGLADSHEKNIFHLQRRLKTHKDLNDLGPVEPNISPPPAPQESVEDEFNTMVDTEVEM